MKPFSTRLGHPRACQPDPSLSNFPEEDAGETQPFSLQSASCPRRCWCRSGYPHPSLPPFWKHKVRRPPTAPAHQCTPRFPLRPRRVLRYPTPHWRARRGWGRSALPLLLKALAEVSPVQSTLESAGEEAVAGAAGRGRAGPGRLERAGP